MKRMILSVLFAATIAASAHAANIRIPTDQANLNLAVAAANDGDTITITDSATYVGNFKITKPNLKIVAAAGQKPTLQSASGGTTPTLLFDANSGGTKFGSLAGGRIRINFVKPATNTAVVPTGFVKFGQSTDTLVTMENVLIDESGASDGSGFGVTAICHDINNHNAVTLRYVDINTSHSITGAATTYGIIFGNGPGALNTGYPSYLYNSMGGPTYTMDHVKVRYYCVAGVMQCMTSTTLNMSYCEVGTLGDSGREPTNTSRPWGSFNQNGVANASTTARMDHCIWKGSRAGNNFQVDAAGTSITANRTVFVNNLYAMSGSGGIYIHGVAAYAGLGGKTYFTADHCDFVGISTASTLFSSTQLKTNYPTINITTSTLNLPVVAISNSNVYADLNTPIFFGKANSSCTLTTDYTNVFTGGTNTSFGYTAGTGDKAWDPLYFDAANCDFRYSNVTLRTADSDGRPIGVNSNYADMWNINYPWWPQLNRAHGWATLK